MLKKYLILFETKNYEWVAFSTPKADAKRLLNVNKTYSVFYIFECDLLKEPYIMKLKAPLSKYYDCKKINKYKEDIFAENDEYIIISNHEDRFCFDIKYSHSI
jgi:hypothetical protein